MIELQSKTPKMYATIPQWLINKKTSEKTFRCYYYKSKKRYVDVPIDKLKLLIDKGYIKYQYKDNKGFIPSLIWRKYFGY